MVITSIVTSFAYVASMLSFGTAGTGDESYLAYETFVWRTADDVVAQGCDDNDGVLYVIGVTSPSEFVPIEKARWYFHDWNGGDFVARTQTSYNKGGNVSWELELGAGQRLDVASVRVAFEPQHYAPEKVDLSTICI